MSIEVKNLNFSYGNHQVLFDMDFTVRKGEFLSILGPNGVGKSTLFQCILGLLTDYSGTVLIDGKDRRTFTVRESARHIAYIPQNSAPVFNFSAFDIVLMGRTSAMGSFCSPRKEDLQMTHCAMEKMGISHLEARCFHKLSGGEQQLVLIARAICQDAPILMLDEPTASLDFGNQIRVLTEIQNLAREGYTIIQTTHNPEQSYMFSDRILAIQNGRIIMDGLPSEVLSTEIMQKLYDVDVDVLKLCNDRIRCCIPRQLTAE